MANLKRIQIYTFKMKVYNTKYYSDYSDEITVSTLIKISTLERINFKPKDKTLLLVISNTCRTLMTYVEKSDVNQQFKCREDSQSFLCERKYIRPSGMVPPMRADPIRKCSGIKAARSSGSSLRA